VTSSGPQSGHQSGPQSGHQSRFRTWSDTNNAQLRIGDAEREDAAAALGEHYASGRLSKEEYDERTSVVWEAKTLTTLQPLFADLPLPHGPLGPAAPAWSAGRRPQPDVGAPWSWRIPWLPILLVCIVLSAVFNAPIFLLAIAGWLLFAKGRHHHRRSGRSYAMGSCGRGRSSWA